MQRILFSLLFVIVTFLSFPFRASAQTTTDEFFFQLVAYDDYASYYPSMPPNSLWDRTYVMFYPQGSTITYQIKNSAVFADRPGLWTTPLGSSQILTTQGLPMGNCMQIPLGFSVHKTGKFLLLMSVDIHTTSYNMYLWDSQTRTKLYLFTNGSVTHTYYIFYVPNTADVGVRIDGRFALYVNNESCDNYTLTVVNGVTPGTYSAGTVVPISANTAPSGQVFDKWTGDVAGIANVNDPKTTYTMGMANATVTANYRKLPDPLPMPMIVSGNVRSSGAIRSDESVHLFADSGRIDIDNTANNTLIPPLLALLKTDTIIFYSNDTSDGLLRNLNTSGGVQGIATIAQPREVIVRKTFAYNKYTYISLPFTVAPNFVLQGKTNTSLTRGASGNYWSWGFNPQVRSGNQGFLDPAVWTKMVAADNFVAANGYQFYYDGPIGGTVDFVTTDATAIKNLFSPTSKSITYNMYKSDNTNIYQGAFDAGWAFIGGLSSAAFTFKRANVVGYDGGTIYYRNTKNSQATNTQTYNTYGEFVLGKDDVEHTTTGPLGTQVTPAKILNVGPYSPFYIQGNITNVGGPIPGTIAFNPEGFVIDSISFRSSNAEAGAKDQLYFVLSSDKDNSAYDRFYLDFDGSYSESYRPVEDAIKLSTAFEDRPAVWSLQKGVNNSALVVSGLPMKDNREVQMGFSVPEAGNYTISLSSLRNQDVRNVVLVDNVTGRKVDLIQEGYYSFNTKAIEGENGRFILYINSAYTGTPAINASDTYAYARDNILTVKNLTVGDRVQILDVAGRTISTGTASGNEFSTAVSQKGIYLVNVKGEKASVIKVLNK